MGPNGTERQIQDGGRLAVVVTEEGMVKRSMEELKRHEETAVRCRRVGHGVSVPVGSNGI
jgi:hypothetical protein